MVQSERLSSNKQKKSPTNKSPDSFVLPLIILDMPVEVRLSNSRNLVVVTPRRGCHYAAERLSFGRNDVGPPPEDLARTILTGSEDGAKT